MHAVFNTRNFPCHELLTRQVSDKIVANYILCAVFYMCFILTCANQDIMQILDFIASELNRKGEILRM